MVFSSTGKTGFARSQYVSISPSDKTLEVNLNRSAGVTGGLRINIGNTGGFDSSRGVI